MKSLLVAINSKYIHSNLAVYSLKAYSKESHMEVEIAEFTINQYIDYICKEIYLKKPDIVAFSCYIWNIDYVYAVSCELKKVLPNVKIWLGGPEVTYDGPVVLKEHKYIDGVIIGEGEETFLELMDFYSRSDNYELKAIKGIAYSDSDNIIKTQPRPLMNMDDLPFVYNDLSQFENKIIYYESSRGCPFGCSYCLSSVEKTVRFRNIELVKKEIKFFLDNRVAQVKFVDRTFNCNHNRTLQLLQFIYENDNGITNFHFEIAADLLQEDEIQIIKKLRPGLIQLEIGVQSTNIDTIHEIDRVMDFKKLSQVVNEINEGHNVHQHLDLIAGLPYENLESFIKSFNDVYSLKPEQMQLGFLKVLKGSKMHKKAKEYGIRHIERPPYEVILTNWVSYEDILTLKNIEEVVELYYNSGQYPYTIQRLLKEFENPYEMYFKLAAYYEENKLFEIKHSRITRYMILLDFIKTLPNAAIREFEQILLYDLYLRENLKTRPQFADEISTQKQLLRNMYIQCSFSKNAHIEIFDKNIEEMCDIKLPRLKKIDEAVDMDSEKTYIIFDYDNRNPLNYQAKTAAVERRQD